MYWSFERYDDALTREIVRLRKYFPGYCYRKRYTPRTVPETTERRGQPVRSIVSPSLSTTGASQK